MSVVDLSARDPIFFLHHANVDRLWAAWNRRGNANSPEPMWRNFAFNRNFVDGDGSPWNVAVGDLGSPAALGYRYDDDDGPFAADLVMPAGDLMTEKLHAYRRLDARGADRRRGQRRPAPDRAAVRRRDLRRGRRERAGCVARPADRDFRAARPSAWRHRRRSGAGVPSRPAGRPKQNRRYVWAALRDIEQPLDATTRVRVFCQLPRTHAAHAPRRSELCDQRQLLRRRARQPRRRPVNAAWTGASVYIDLTQALARMDHPRSLRSDRLTVQLLPHCSNSEANVSNIRPRRVEVVIL